MTAGAPRDAGCSLFQEPRHYPGRSSSWRSTRTSSSSPRHRDGGDETCAMENAERLHSRQPSSWRATSTPRCPWRRCSTGTESGSLTSRPRFTTHAKPAVRPFTRSSSSRSPVRKARGSSGTAWPMLPRCPLRVRRSRPASFWPGVPTTRRVPSPTSSIWVRHYDIHSALPAGSGHRGAGSGHQQREAVLLPQPAACQRHGNPRGGRVARPSRIRAMGSGSEPPHEVTAFAAKLEAHPA